MASNVTVSARIDTGIECATTSGEPLRFAAIDADGRVVECGTEFAEWIFKVATEAHENFWRGQGHLKAIHRGNEK